MRNKLLIISIICLLFVSFTVTADSETSPQVAEGERMTRRGMPQGERTQGDFVPGQPPQGDMETVPPSGVHFVPETEITEIKEPELTETPSVSTESPSQNIENTESDANTVEDKQSADMQPQMLEMNMDGGMRQRGQFNPENMQGFPFGQNNQTEQEPEKPYEKWITPVISAVLLVFGFVFVALYKRKQY